MTRSQILAILVLPTNALLSVPAIILWVGGEMPGSWGILAIAAPRVWLAAIFVGAGLVLMVRTIAQFTTMGQGSLAPWSPTQKLVVAGVYRHVRNPMISGVISALVGEALLFQSWLVFAWAILFAAMNALYMPLSEEPSLERRFGDAYRAYKRNVPRWIPRLTPWDGADRGPGAGRGVDS